MFLVVTLVGLGAVQIRHNGLWGEPYTPDVIAAADILNLGRDDVSNNLRLILDNPEAVTAGANARSIEEDVYITYLNLKVMTDALDVVAEIMGITSDELSADPSKMLSNDDAITVMANAMGIETYEFKLLIEAELAEHSDEADSEQMQAMQQAMMAGLTAAAEVLNMDVGDLASRMGRIKNNHSALEAMVHASGMPEEMIVGMINQQLANDEMTFDKGIDFNVEDYINLNLGIFLLMFAIAGISFLFSCVFNLTKHSLALGAGIPIACLILEIMSQASSDLENLKYLSINTLFDPSSITGGGTFIPQFIALAVMGTVMYVIGIKVFKEKDLPL